MIIKNTQLNYGIVSISLHWLMAILIIGLFVLGKYMIDLDLYNSNYHLAPQIHKSVGIMVFGFLLVRLIWRLINLTPSPLSNYKKYELKLAKIIHISFYIFIFVACCSGYLISTATGVGVDIFNSVNIPSLLVLNENQAEIVAEIHELSVHILLFLFALHMVGALKHHFLDRDITLRRMFATSVKEPLNNL